MAGEKNKKKAFVLRMSPEKLKLLEKWAADEFRSLNGQIEYLLHRALLDSGRMRTNRSGAESRGDKSGNDHNPD